jgi:hypothetical protein
MLVGYPRDSTEVIDSAVWDPATGAWQASARLSIDRMTYAVTGLADGRVLLIGGNDEDVSYPDAYLLDPASGAWVQTGSMARDRSHPGAVLLPDGRVLVVGGHHFVPLAESLSAGMGLASWPAGPTSDRAGATPFDVYTPPHGRALATAEVFDPASGTWQATGPMRYARTGPALTVLADGRVLVVGSTDDTVHIDDGAYRTAEIYDPKTGTFELAGTFPRLDRSTLGHVSVPDSAPLPGILGTLVALPDGGAVLVGHQDYWSRTATVVRSYRMSSDGNTWRDIAKPVASDYREKTRFIATMLGAVVADLPDGSVLVAGGTMLGPFAWSEIEALPSEVRRYDPAADAWSSLPAMPDGRLDMLGVRLTDGSVLLAGGVVVDGSGSIPDWAFDAIRYVPASP